MPGISKETAEKTPIRKGQKAEDAILEYMKKMNPPFGANDVTANLKGAVPKTTTQKLLASLAEKGELTQKQHGTTWRNRTILKIMPADKLTTLEADFKFIEDENKALGEEPKAAAAVLNKVKSAPTDEELRKRVKESEATIEKTINELIPLRSGTSLISREDIEQLDKDWHKWRKEWTDRRKVFMNLWHLVSDSLPPQEATDLAEELGVEYDTSEHADIERGPYCAAAP